jgi:hypothetical protein
MDNENLIEWATKHEQFLERLLAKCGGAVGEILVEDELKAQGYDVEPAKNNARQRDILATSGKGTKFRVEVKTGRQKRPTWLVRTCPDVEACEIWCLVCAPRKPNALPDRKNVEIYVLTSAEARDIWLSSDWNKKNPTNGDIRRNQVPDTALAAWHKLPDYKTPKK